MSGDGKVFTYMKTPSDANNCKNVDKAELEALQCTQRGSKLVRIGLFPPPQTTIIDPPPSRIRNKYTNTNTKTQIKDKNTKTGQICFVPHLQTDNIDPPPLSITILDKLLKQNRNQSPKLDP